jgi:predicted DNA-binding protein (UPF0251 family)
MSETEIVSLGMDELEVLRLCDSDGLTQEEAGKKIGVSRGTVQRLMKSGRKKVIGCILEQKALVISKSGEHIQDLNDEKGEQNAFMYTG